MISTNYFNSLQKEINAKMRFILIDWLIETSMKFKLKEETLFLGINYLDRFLSKRQILRQDFQLLGITCLFIAAKYEEIYPPDIKNFLNITAQDYKKETMLKIESEIIKSLDFKLNFTSPLFFLNEFLSCTNFKGEKEEMLCKYLIELGLLEF